MTNKYFALEIGTARVCACYETPINDAYGCIVYEGNDIEVIKTPIEQPDSEFPMTPSYIISYNPDHASFEQYRTAAIRHVNLHDYTDEDKIFEAINKAKNIAAIDKLIKITETQAWSAE